VSDDDTRMIRAGTLVPPASRDRMTCINTATVRRIGQQDTAHRVNEAVRGLPAERVYPLGTDLASRIGASPGHPAAPSGRDGAR
jgi:hypothetical protein